MSNDFDNNMEQMEAIFQRVSQETGEDGTKINLVDYKAFWNSY